jgi:hypothetical protein
VADRPYKAEERNGYWLLVDTRTGEPASYPTTKANARAEASLMNRAYADALASQASS